MRNLGDEMARQQVVTSHGEARALAATRPTLRREGPKAMAYDILRRTAEDLESLQESLKL